MEADYGAGYTRLYREHWWWRAREAIVLRELARLPLVPPLEVLDVGCGDALSFPALEAFGNVRGIELDTGLLDPGGRYRARIATRPLGDPFYDQSSWRFDLITALDVIEHIEDDASALGSMVEMLKPGGHLLLTVPAFPILWDHHDELNHHHRRYTEASLKRLLEGEPLEALRVRYLFASLFLPKLAVRLLNGGRQAKLAQHGIPPRAINKTLRRGILMEERLTRNLGLPFGTSLLAVARRHD